MNFFDFSITGAFGEMLAHFILLMLTVSIITHCMYYRKSKRLDFYFTFILMSVAIFFLVYFMFFGLQGIKFNAGIGIGIGLFGIFSIMRFRTESMPVREMTYMFVIIALAVINAIATQVSALELVLINLIIMLCVWLCEKRLHLMPSKMVQYDRIELIQPSRRNELIDDLQNRLGLHVTGVEVGGIDFLRDMAVLKVYYEGEKNDDIIDHQMHLTQDDYANTDPKR